MLENCFVNVYQRTFLCVTGLISRDRGLSWCNHAFCIPTSALIPSAFICYCEADKAEFLLAGTFHLLARVFVLDEKAALGAGPYVWTHRYTYHRLGRTGLQDLQSWILPSAASIAAFCGARRQPWFEAVPAKIV